MLDDDPGWLWSPNTTNPQSRTTPLWVMRVMFAGLAGGVTMFTIVTAFIVATSKNSGDSSMVLPIVVVVLGGALLAFGPRLAPALDDGSDAAMVSSYRTRMVMLAAIGEGPTMFAIVIFLVTHAWWMLAVAIVFGIVGFGAAAPTRKAIERDQDRLGTLGSSRSLWTVLTKPGAPSAT